MKFLVLALLFAAAPYIQATSFLATSNGVGSSLNTLQASIARIRQVSQAHGHTQITNKCDQAQSHLKLAQGAFGQLQGGFLHAPWNARGSSQANQVRTRLSLCGNVLNSIYAQPEMKSFPEYKSPMSQSQATYRSVQKGCQDIWQWPAPNSGESDDDDSYSKEGYGSSYTPPSSDYAPRPKPSQAHSGYFRRSTSHKIRACQNSETSCPINSVDGGYECLDLKVEVGSCGGCVSKKEGENCLLIEGADGVGCLEGKCVVLSVKEGYAPGANGRPTLIGLHQAY
ncbi:uncharacterized protein MELLADRAFT_72264 [Melampsora larici-populina 98AG31]|uniref:Protein CPL1-like domain-containing protein n=1 Tax=Melampsora larici-populina (strain 98AG31 / pathotype 3-4-7) TaxID=747676 RepID=F4RRQ5_MELLP|nr:uncharacterized protein MELLADRAFT_72264 [Melampsora larici-populina 98AG31]EGG04968.1 hypothetical protein MELLADRAFT_72264 [Melampsora larici-populina 98AG31]